MEHYCQRLFVIPSCMMHAAKQSCSPYFFKVCDEKPKIIYLAHSKKAISKEIALSGEVTMFELVHARFGRSQEFWENPDIFNTIYHKVEGQVLIIIIEPHILFDAFFSPVS